jgi:alanyl-tRNA synthetase
MTERDDGDDRLVTGETVFTGYDELETETTVRGILRGGELARSARAGDTVEAVLDRTLFYAESGGQAPDAGMISAAGARLRVTDVQRPVKGLITHSAVVE